MHPLLKKMNLKDISESILCLNAKEELLEIIKSWGISNVNYKFTGDEDFLKNSLLYHFKIKNGIIYGIK